MKICLLNAPPLKKRSETTQIHPPLGILYLAAYLRKESPDVQVKVIDGNQLGVSKSIASIEAYRPDVIGISFTTPTANGAYQIINEVKKEGLLVVAGGAHPTVMPEEVLNQTKTDVVVMGEGELTFAEIIKNYRQSNRIPDDLRGTARRDGTRIIINPPRSLIRDLDSIPFPARDLIDVKSYPGHYLKKRKHDTTIVLERGCPYNCTFCGNPVWKYTTPYFRVRSPKDVVDEMEFIVKNYGIREFMDWSDGFNLSPAWAKQLCDEIINRGLDVSLKAQIRLDRVDDELAQKMAKAGFWMVCGGIESGNEETLKGIGKGITTSQVESALGILKKHGMRTLGYFMLFNAWEEEGKLRYEGKTECENTLRFVKKLLKEKKLDFFSWSLATPMPGSQLWEIASRHGLMPEDLKQNWDALDSVSNFVMTLPGVTERDWVDIKEKGERLQARMVLRSRNMKLSALPLYFARGKGMLRRNIKMGTLKMLNLWKKPR